MCLVRESSKDRVCVRACNHVRFVCTKNKHINNNSNNNNNKNDGKSSLWMRDHRDTYKMRGSLGGLVPPFPHFLPESPLCLELSVPFERFPLGLPFVGFSARMMGSMLDPFLRGLVCLSFYITRMYWHKHLLSPLISYRQPTTALGPPHARRCRCSDFVSTVQDCSETGLRHRKPLQCIITWLKNGTAAKHEKRWKCIGVNVFLAITISH